MVIYIYNVAILFSDITSKSDRQLLKRFLFKYINIVQVHAASNFINI